MKKTYADVANALHKKKGKWEEQLSSPDKIQKETASRMISRIDAKLDELFQTQESSKPQINSTPRMKWGGHTSSPIWDNSKVLDSPLPEVGGLAEFAKSDTPGSIFNMGGGSIIAGQEEPESPSGAMSFMNDNAENIFKGAGVLAKYFARQGAINNMESPEAPAYAPTVNLDGSYDVSHAEGTIRRNKLLASKSANRANTQGASFAMKSAADRQEVNALSALLDKRENHRTQVQNQEAGINANIHARNTYALNSHLKNLNKFKNQKTQARAKNFESILTAVDTYGREKRAQEHDLLRLKILSKPYNRAVMSDVMKDVEGLAKFFE